MNARDEFVSAVGDIPDDARNFSMIVKANWIAANRTMSALQWSNAAQSLRAAIALLPQPPV